MATYTSIINSVLRRLREDEVAGPTSTDYSTLIGDFVNETKREVEDAWKWQALRTTIPVTTADGTTQYAITGAGKRFRLQDRRNSVYDVTNKARIYPQSAAYLKQGLLENPDTGFPMSYYLEGFDSNQDPYINFYQTPGGVYTINIECIVPQADFTVGTEVLSVPDYPVLLGAYAKAIAERGEDDGRTHGEVLHKYGLALNDAISFDVASVDDSETNWYA